MASSPINIISYKSELPVLITEVGEKYPELKRILDKIPIKELYPTQAEAIEKGALENSFLLASGTGSGKTLIALLAAARQVLRGKKVLYLAPLRSLAFEKRKDFGKLPFRTTISIGDMDSDDPWLANFDIIVATYEKAESLIRHKPSWLKEIGLVIFDEAHEMMRKPLIETLAIKFSWAQMLLLSATIGNVNEVAEWLGVEHLESNFRPVPLREGVLKGREIVWTDGKEELLSEFVSVTGIVQDSLARGHQTLIFTNTRREAESVAQRVADLIKPEKLDKLAEIADAIEHALDYSTRQCKKLADLVRKGAAFHHAGLVNEQRILVENAFREGLIKVLGSTVTLVAGLNLPSRRVVIKSPNFAGKPWPVSLYKQAAGRSGRPGLDTEGEAIILHNRPEFAQEYYINGEVEPIRSPLAHEPTLRKEIIGLFASGFAMNKKDIEAFMKRSFYAYQFGDSQRIVEISERVLEKLVNWKMLKGEEVLSLTRLGRRVAETYVDPYTAHVWIQAFESTSPFGYIHLIGMGGEMDLPRIRSSEGEELLYTLASRGDELVYPRPNPWDWEFETYLRSLKLAQILEDWIGEKSEDEILNRWNIAPGDLRNYVKNAEWLSYAMEQIIEIEKGKKADLRKLSLRIKHGVKNELLGLVKLRGIGRVKARRLWKEGITEKTIGKVPLERLEKLVGKSTARKIATG